MCSAGVMAVVTAFNRSTVDGWWSLSDFRPPVRRPRHSVSLSSLVFWPTPDSSPRLALSLLLVVFLPSPSARQELSCSVAAHWGPEYTSFRRSSLALRLDYGVCMSTMPTTDTIINYTYLLGPDRNAIGCEEIFSARIIFTPCRVVVLNVGIYPYHFGVGGINSGYHVHHLDFSF